MQIEEDVSPMIIEQPSYTWEMCLGGDFERGLVFSWTDDHPYPHWFHRWTRKVVFGIHTRRVAHAD